MSYPGIALAWSVYLAIPACLLVGIGIGSLGCEKLLKGVVSGTFAPAGALGMS